MTIQLDGTLNFGTDHWDLKQWPRNADNGVLACFALYSCKNFTLTSSGEVVEFTSKALIPLVTPSPRRYQPSSQLFFPLVR